jgi:transposase
MRGWDVRSEVLFSYVNCERRVPKDHPLRAILRIVDEALAALSPEFEGRYAKFGRPSIPPERLLRALLLQAFYSVRSEKQLMEQLEYNLLFRWFVGLSLDDEIWDETVFTKNRERLIEGDIAKKFMAAVLDQEAVPGGGAPPRRRRAEMASATFTARNAATRHTPRPPTPTPGCIVRDRASPPSWPIWGMC